jgi:hypothetical protein
MGRFQGRIEDFKLGGAHLKTLRRAEGGAKILGVFRVKNHDFTPRASNIYRLLHLINVHIKKNIDNNSSLQK